MQLGLGTGCVLKRVSLRVAKACGFNTEPEVQRKYTQGNTVTSEGLSGASTGGVQQPGCLLRDGLW